MANQTDRIQWISEGWAQDNILTTLPWVLLGLFSLWLFIRIYTRMEEKKAAEKRAKRKKELQRQNKEMLEKRRHLGRRR